MSYIGNSPVLHTTEYREEHTVTGSPQNLFNTLGYAPGYISVYRNGVRLAETEDFLATDGASVLLNENAEVGDIIAFEYRTEVTPISNNSIDVSKLNLLNDSIPIDAVNVTANSISIEALDGQIELDKINITADSISLDSIALTENGIPISAVNTAGLSANTAVIEGSSSGDLVRITQTGSGNALVVEDSANTDSTPFVIDAGGKVIAGSQNAITYSSSLSIVPQVQQNTLGATQLGISRFSSGSAGQPSLVFLKTRGPNIGDFGIVQNGDNLGKILFLGGDGSDGILAADISAELDGTPSTNDMPGRLVFSTTADGASVPTERMRIDSSGSITAGSVSLGGVGFQLRSDGILIHSKSGTGTNTHARYTNGNGIVGSITTNGSSTAYNTSSDYRLKENITDITDGISRIKQLNPSRFNFIADPDRTVDGFIAHEVQGIVPEAISGEKDAVNEDGSINPQGIDQSKLIPLLTAALQESIALIESQQSQIDALTARIETGESNGS